MTAPDHIPEPFEELLASTEASTDGASYQKLNHVLQVVFSKRWCEDFIRFSAVLRK